MSKEFEAARDEAVERCQRAMGLTQAGMDEALKQELAQHLRRLSDWSRRWVYESDPVIKGLVEAHKRIINALKEHDTGEREYHMSDFEYAIKQSEKALAAFEQARTGVGDE